jgi:hypothetical protein
VPKETEIRVSQRAAIAILKTANRRTQEAKVAATIQNRQDDLLEIRNNWSIIRRYCSQIHSAASAATITTETEIILRKCALGHQSNLRSISAG